MAPFVRAPLSGPSSPFFAVRQAGSAVRSPLAALAEDDVRARPSPSAKKAPCKPNQRQPARHSVKRIPLFGSSEGDRILAHNLRIRVTHT
jgi:hypothetical protein